MSHGLYKVVQYEHKHLPESVQQRIYMIEQRGNEH